MSRSGGFVMADALVGLTILSVLLSALIPLSRSGQNALEKAEARLNALLVARSVLEASDLNEEEGEITLNGHTYNWHLETETLPGNFDDQAHTEDRRVRVYWQGLSGQQVAELSVRRWGLK